jgi:hypothetical protein
MAGQAALSREVHPASTPPASVTTTTNCDSGPRPALIFAPSAHHSPQLLPHPHPNNPAVPPPNVGLNSESNNTVSFSNAGRARSPVSDLTRLSGEPQVRPPSVSRGEKPKDKASMRKKESVAGRAKTPGEPTPTGWAVVVVRPFRLNDPSATGASPSATRAEPKSSAVSGRRSAR